MYSGAYYQSGNMDGYKEGEMAKRLKDSGEMSILTHIWYFVCSHITQPFDDDTEE